MAAKRKSAEALAAEAAGKAIDTTGYIGRKVYSRGSKTRAGTITGISRCTLSGCRANRVHVRWPDGKRTYPCLKGCRERPDGDLEIR